MKRLFVLLLIALASFGLAALAAKWAPRFVADLQNGSSDFLFIRHEGPGLGRREASQNIVLVLYDAESGKELGLDEKYQNDLALYQSLFNAGAQVVYDTRLLAVGDQALLDQLRPLMDGMLKVNDQGKLMRDLWFTAEMQPSLEPTYGKLSAQNIINTQPHFVPSLRARLYPLMHITSAGLKEGAPLAIARKVWGMPNLSSEELIQNLLKCGVLEAWHKMDPKGINKPAETYPRTPYPIGNKKITWHIFASTVPIVPQFAFWVSYDPLVSQYPRFSYVQAMKSAQRKDFEGKVVLVGYAPEMDPSSDVYEVPCEVRKAASAEVAAAAVQTLLDQRLMDAPPERLSYALIGGMALLMALAGGTLKPLTALFANLFILLAYYSAICGAYWQGWWCDCALAPGAGILSAAMAGVYNAFLSSQARRRVMDLFGRYVPRAVVDQMLKRPDYEALALGGEKRNVTVLFADIRGFTSFSEDMPPEEVIRQLNSLLRIMVDCTFEFQGTLDKFIGDAILVLFNAPLDQQDHGIRGIQLALTIQKRLQGHATGLSVGIGVHCGEAVVGNVGTPQRLEYTAIGSTVNIASRLCDFAKAGEIVISSAMLEYANQTCKTAEIGPIQVKGIKQQLTAHRASPQID